MCVSVCVGWGGNGDPVCLFGRATGARMFLTSSHAGQIVLCCDCRQGEVGQFDRLQSDILPYSIVEMSPLIRL